MVDNGKKFEAYFKENWLETVGGLCYRLPDQMSGYKKTSRNPCDFLCYKKPDCWMIECKTHAGNTLPFDAIRQYDEMLKYESIEGLNIGVIA